MHSSRMRTARSSSRLLGGVCLITCWDTSPPITGCGPGDPPPARPLNLPLGCGPKDPPGQTPQPPPPWVWAWRPPSPVVRILDTYF